MGKSEILMTLELADGQTKIEGAQLMPIGKWKHPRGEINITPERARKFAEGFKRGVAGQDLPILFIHSDKANSSNPLYGQAAGWVTDVRADDSEGVLLDIEFNEEGAQAVREKKYRYLSAEFFDKVQLPHHERPEEDVIMGAALVNRPHLKGMKPILNEETGHLLVAEESDNEGGGPMDPILVTLAELAGVELSEDADSLTDEQREKIKEWAEGLNKSVSDATAKINLLETKLDEAEDPDERKVKNLREDGYEEEATLLEEYRADKAVRELSEKVPEGSKLTKPAEEKLRAFVKDKDHTALQELLTLAVEGKAVVDLSEKGTGDGGGSDDDTPDDLGKELIEMANTMAKEDEITFSEAMDRVAQQNPDKWNEYQLSMGSSESATIRGGEAS